MTNPAATERELLCNLFPEVGPQAPTLCGDWTTLDLAAHLVVRDRRPDSLPGLVFDFAAGHTEKLRLEATQQPFEELVDQVRSGPPRWSPTSFALVDKATNTIEFFVHHEDVRRGSGSGAGRDLPAATEDELWSGLKRVAPVLRRQSPAPLTIATDDGRELKIKSGPSPVRVTGPVGELVLFMYGRQAVAHVDVAGDQNAIDQVMTAAFGV
ncbi:MAG: TIGR03085 family protein [Acidimicrobiales bacterium]|nr:TIGR03085 family protein [Acidimicrobiales bacterium]